MPNDMSQQPEATVENTVSRADLTEAVRSTAILAKLTIGVWSGEKTDKKISAKLKHDAHAVGNTGRYIKNLLSGCDSELKAAHAVYGRVRDFHLTHTLPWQSDPRAERQRGPRLLPNMLFHAYVRDMGTLQREAKQTVDAFLAEYANLITQAQANLAGMGDPDDYPTVDEVRARFRIDVDFQPVPDVAGFQGLPDAMLEKLGERLKVRQERAIAASQAEMWARVRESVGHLVDRLEDPETRFKATTVESVRELITLLPGFNCAGDQRVDPVVAEIHAMLDGISAEDIRKNDKVRQDVVSRAQAITSKLDSWGL